MSGFTPIEFTKAATKEGGRIPTNEEKDADALQRVAAAFGSAPEMKADSADPGPQLIAGDASGSGLMKPESMAADLATSFDPTAAAGAINAVIVPPTSAAGLEDGVEQMEVDKKSDDDWLIADPVPLTETEMVGTFLQDQEKKDREQYVFLTQEDANMETVKDTLSELTEHIHRLSVGDFQADVVGPQTDGPKRVEVEPAGDGLFRLTCFPEPFPHVSRYVSSLLGGLSVQEVAQLFDVFRGKPLTRAGVERALECYIIVKRAKEHGKLLARKFLKPSEKRGLGYGEMHEVDAGAAMEMMCPTCLTPRDPEKKKCLFCKSTEDAVHYTQPMASMLVDGKLWELRFEADGTYHWEAEGVTQEEKDAAMVDISNLAQSPSPSMDPREASFADQVPQSLRIKLRDQVVTNAPDPALMEALAKRNERPHLKQEEDKTEGQKVFHPGAAKAMKLRQATLCDPIEPPKVDPAKIEEAVTLTTEVLGEMQSGALSVADKEALGAKVLRQLDMEHYKECLKRSYLDGPGASILHAQTSIEKAREQNLAQQARGQKMAASLHLIPEPRSLWSNRARAAFEQNVFAPEYEMDDAMAIDHEAVITEYKEMKGFLQTSNTRQFAPKLYSHLPETPVKELELDGTMVGPAHPPHTDVQPSFRRTSPVWRSLEVGLWTFQSTQVGQAAETGGADSPRDPDTSSTLRRMWGSRWKLACDQPQRRSVVDFGLPMMRSATGRGRPRLGPCLPCSTSMAMLGPWRSCTASGVRCPWWSNVPAGDKEKRPRNTRPTCRRPRMRCSSSWMPTTLEDPNHRQSGVNAIGSWASFWPCGRSWPTPHR